MEEIWKELATFDDVFWNAESIGRSLKSKKSGKAIAMAIKRYVESEKK